MGMNFFGNQGSLSRKSNKNWNEIARWKKGWEVIFHHNQMFSHGQQKIDAMFTSIHFNSFKNIVYRIECSSHWFTTDRLLVSRV
jgi:hypothetical protein